MLKNYVCPIFTVSYGPRKRQNLEIIKLRIKMLEGINMCEQEKERGEKIIMSLRQNKKSNYMTIFI